MKSIETKQKIYKSFLNEKNQVTKNDKFDSYKKHRNMLSQLIRRSKENHFKLFFNEHRKDLRKTWQGIKSIISKGKCNETIPTSMSIGGKLTNTPSVIANAFNDYFGQGAENTKANIPPTDISPFSYLTNPNEKTIYMYPTDSVEILNIIYSYEKLPTIKIL